MAEQVLRDTGDMQGHSPGRPGWARTLLKGLDSPYVRALLVLCGLALVYLAVNLGWLRPLVASAALRSYVVQPVLWTALAALVLLLWRGGPTRPQLRLGLVPVAVLIGLFQLSAYVIAGLFVGFGHSPYNHRSLALLANVAFFTSSIVALELARAYLLALWRPREPALAMAVVGLLFAFLSIPLAQVTSPQSGEVAVRFLGLRVLPAAGEHMLTTGIALAGGPVAAMAYRGVLHAFEWLSPVLPDLPWALMGALGLAVPYIGYRALQGIVAPAGKPATAEASAQEKQSDRPLPWLVLAFISVGIIWFSLGLFPYHMLAAAGQSMAPHIQRGDLVILRNVEASEVSVGDVVQYSTGEVSILHRVVEERQSPSGGPLFITRGDANNIADPQPVEPGQLLGKEVFTVPKIGWVGILVNRVFARVARLF